MDNYYKRRFCLCADISDLKTVVVRICVLMIGAVSFLIIAGCDAKFNDEIAAIVNDRPVSMEALNEALLPWHGQEDAGNYGRITARVLDGLIEEELIIQLAEHLGINVSGPELEKAAEEIKADFPGRSFEDMLIREFINYESWKKRLHRNMLIRKVTESVLEKRFSFDPQQWDEFFQANYKTFKNRERIRVRHITVSEKKVADKIEKQLKKDGNIEKALKRTAKTGQRVEVGEARWVYLHLLPEDMAEAIRDTETGKVSGLVESQFGYSYFKVIEREEPSAPGPVEVMAELRKIYKEMVMAEDYELWTAELRRNAAIEINPVLMKAGAELGPRINDLP